MNKTKTASLYGVIIVIIISVFLGIPAFNRYQNIQNANNEVLVNEIRIRQQEQLIQVEKQKAEIRVQDAIGIAKSQQIIAESLTEQYLQYLAIDAQKAMANGQNHTEIYIPSGLNGIPLIKEVSPKNH